MANNILSSLAGFLSSGLLWLYIIIVIIVFYAIISLLTWSIKKPLMFLGIPSILVGIFLIILKYSINLFPLEKNILAILNSSVKPLFLNGIICIVLGIGMIATYKLLNIKTKKIENKEVEDTNNNNENTESIS